MPVAAGRQRCLAGAGAGASAGAGFSVHAMKDYLHVDLGRAHESFNSYQSSVYNVSVAYRVVLM